MKLLLVVILAGRLVADIATPLQPGAFRFDANESVEILGMRTARDAPMPCVRAVQPDPADDSTPCRLAVAVQRPRRQAPSPLLPRAMTARPGRTAPASSSEDG